MSRLRLYNDPRTHHWSFQAMNQSEALCGRIPAVSTVVREQVPGASVLIHQFKWVDRNYNKQVMCNTASSMASKETLAWLMSFPWKPQQAGTSDTCTLWDVVCKNTCPMPKRHSGLLFTAPWSPWSVWWAVLFLVVATKEAARNQEDCEPDTGPQLGLTFPEGTPAKENIPCYKSGEQTAKIHVHWEVRTCQMGKARNSCWKLTHTDSGQTCTSFDPAAQCLQWLHEIAEPDFPEIQASFWPRKKKT